MGQGPDESKRWQVWAVAVPNAVVSYRLQDSRSIEAAQHVLGGYQGTVMADGYGATIRACKTAERSSPSPIAGLTREGSSSRLRNSFPSMPGRPLIITGELYGVERLCSDWSTR